MIATKDTAGRALAETLMGDVAAYVRFVADNFLRLRDWAFDCVPGGDDGDSIATIDCVTGRKLAVIRFRPRFFDADADEQKHVVIHEVLHVHFHRLRVGVGFLQTAGAMPQGTFEIFRLQHDEHVEEGLDEVAAAISLTVPNPEEWRSGLSLPAALVRRPLRIDPARANSRASRSRIA